MSWPIRNAILLPVLVAVVTSACSDTSPGQAVPTANSTSTRDVPITSSKTSAPTSSSGQSLDALDPCTLLTAGEVGQFGANAGKREDTSQTRACQWLVPGGNGGFTVDLRSSQGLKDIFVGRGKMSDQRVGSHGAKIVKEINTTGECMISIGIAESSRVDVQSLYKTDTLTACDRATKVAELIEPRLPKGE